MMVPRDEAPAAIDVLTGMRAAPAARDVPDDPLLANIYVEEDGA
jgi:hypothetical protein